MDAFRETLQDGVPLGNVLLMLALLAMIVLFVALVVIRQK